MTSQTGKQKIAIHMLPNISRNKVNKTMKYGQLIEYYLKNTFFLKKKKSFTKCGGETVARQFSKKSRLLVSLGQ